MNAILKRKIDILFVIPPYHKRNGSGSLFPLGISAIIAYLEEQNFTYDYIDCTKIISSLRDEDLRNLEQLLKTKFQQFDPCLVGIGPCVTPGAKGLITVTNCCFEAYGKEIVFAGGPFTSLPSQEWFFYEVLGLKYLIKGDGEKAVCEAIKMLKAGMPLTRCKCVSTPEHSYINIINDLDSMPFPKRIDLENYIFSDRRKLTSWGKTAHIVASRGCPYHCDYCVSGNLRIPFRKRSAENIVGEMKQLSEKYNISDIVFYDDCFFTHVKTVHREIKDFCAAIQDFGVRATWQIEIRPDILLSISDGEFKMLSHAGCRQMNIGIEKTFHDGAATFGKKYNYNKLKNCLAHIHEICPIKLTGTFILGGSGETFSSVRELIQASASMCLDAAEYSPLFVYPDTPIYARMFSSPRSWLDIVLREEEAWGEVVFENENLDKSTLISLVDEAYHFFYRESDLYSSKKVQDRYNLKG